MFVYYIKDSKYGCEKERGFKADMSKDNYIFEYKVMYNLSQKLFG